MKTQNFSTCCVYILLSTSEPVWNFPSPPSHHRLVEAHHEENCCTTFPRLVVVSTFASSYNSWVSENQNSQIYIFSFLSSSCFSIPHSRKFFSHSPWMKKTRIVWWYYDVKSVTQSFTFFFRCGLHNYGSLLSLIVVHVPLFLSFMYADGLECVNIERSFMLVVSSNAEILQKQSFYNIEIYFAVSRCIFQMCDEIPLGYFVVICARNEDRNIQLRASCRFWY